MTFKALISTKTSKTISTHVADISEQYRSLSHCRGCERMTAMSFRFHHLATLSALLFFVLAVTWMFGPSAMLSSWGVAFNDSVGLVGRRAAALYAGMGIMMFMARKAEPSLARSALVSGFVFACVTLAILGVFELVAGRANSGILVAVLIEITLMLVHLFVARVERIVAAQSKIQPPKI